MRNDYFNPKLKTVHENPVKAEIIYRAEVYKIVLLSLSSKYIYNLQSVDSASLSETETCAGNMSSL